jgi:hypothetical protein
MLSACAGGVPKDQFAELVSHTTEFRGNVRSTPILTIPRSEQSSVRPREKGYRGPTVAHA